MLATRFELISELVASFLKLLALRLSSSSSCPVLDLFRQTLTRRPVMQASVRNVPIVTSEDNALLGQLLVRQGLRSQDSHINLWELVD